MSIEAKDSSRIIDAVYFRKMIIVKRCSDVILTGLDSYG